MVLNDGKAEAVARLFIGMPVFAMDRFLEQAIDSLVEQSFEDWKLLIADNHSPDDTPRIGRHFEELDSRITYVRHEWNLGAPANFKYVLEAADCEYFMWAAGDDVWEPGYLASGVAALDSEESVGLAFGDVVNTDSFGEIIRTYPGFDHFSGPVNRQSILHYLLSPEIMGKANLIYGMMRRGVVRAAFHASPLTDNWGSDMAFVLAVLARAGFAYSNTMCLQKRVVRTGDSPGAPEPIVIENPKDHCFQPGDAPVYIADHRRAVRGTPFLVLTSLVMNWRLFSVCARKGTARARLYAGLLARGRRSRDNP